MSRIVHNFEIYDKDKDKEIIEKINKEHQEELKKVDYAIDLNTNKVKQNNHFLIHITDNFNKDKISDDKAIDKQVKDLYLHNMDTFNKGLDTYKDLDNYTSKLDNVDALNYAIKQFNEFFDFHYLQGFNLRVIDLLDNDIKEDYIMHYASAYTMVQITDIEKIDIKKWLNSDLDNIKDFNFHIDKDSLKNIQSNVNKLISDIDSDKVSADAFKKLKDLIYDANLERFTKEIDIYIDADIDYYKKVHKLYQTINKKIINIVNGFKDAINRIKDLSNNDILVSKSKIKLPNRYSIDIDIMQLFNNIYPNYKFKSIDDNRHKDYDIKSKVMLDFNNNEVDNLEDLRLMNFIKNGNIQLFPIQEFLINGFISIRDEQGTDKPIPLLSNLKYINEDSKMRLPTNKKDLQLYEDYMLFFNKCKIQVKIINRKTNEVIFELLKPMSILQNTPYTKEGKYGYYIGNSVINILKDELDELYDAPKITSHLTSKQYLKSSKPSTPPMINVKAYIYPKITTMINTYKNKKTYQNKINIEKLYDYQAYYNKHYKPDKKDRDKTRELLNSYLDDLIKKGLIISYKAINKGKDITTYQIEINKDASV